MSDPAASVPGAPDQSGVHGTAPGSRRIGAGFAAAAVVLLALALAVRVQRATLPFSFYEYASLFFSSRSWRELWSTWMVRETNPALFYSLLKLWRAVVPDEGLALRGLDILFALARMVLLAGFVRRHYGRWSGLLALALVALGTHDIFHSVYLRGYGLAALAITVSFIGLTGALGEPHPGRARRWRGLAAYAAGAVVAIYCHTTMLLWPVIASLAALLALGPRIGWRRLGGLLAANLAVLLAAGWSLWLSWIQLHGHTDNISWIQSLGLRDFLLAARYQIVSSGIQNLILAVVLTAVGTLRGWPALPTRLALFSLALGLVLFKLGDGVHPIVNNSTLFWASTLVVVLMSAALAERNGTARSPVVSAAVLALAVLAGAFQLLRVPAAVPNDWGQVIRTLRAKPGSALVVTHEVMGVLGQQACRLETGSARCPFRLIVLADPRRSDAWSRGAFAGRLVPPDDLPRALAGSREVYVLDREPYEPLPALGVKPQPWPEIRWSDGELIGPLAPATLLDGARHVPAQESRPGG